jgi:transcription elongation factor Elf1
VVFIPIPIQELETEHEQPSRTYKLDIEQGRIFSCGSCNGIEAVNQFIKKTLLTPRFLCMVYSNQYGSEVKQISAASDVTAEYIETELPQLIKEACLTDSRILDVYGFSFKYEDNRAFISFSANTIYGDTTIEEVL